jgi:hypothetical protein
VLFGTSPDIVKDFTLDGKPVRVTMPRPHGPSACLWAVVDDWSLLMPGNLPEEQRAYWQDRLENPDDTLDRSMLRPVAFALAQQVYGVPWWAAHRILEETTSAYLAYQVWCTRRGFHPAEETADRIVASAVAWVSERWSEDSEAKSWQQRVYMPPAGVRG